jgi:hypothetical protein
LHTITLPMGTSKTMDKSDGAIMLYRMILESQVFAHEVVLKIWIWCLLKASYKERFVPLKIGKGTKVIKLLPGQFIFGRNSAEKELKIAGSTVWRWMNKMATDEFEKMIKIESDNQYSIITICKWDEYQTKNFRNEQPMDKQRTSNGQPTDTYNKVVKVNNVDQVNKKKLPIFFNKNFSSEVNALFDEFINHEKEVSHDFNYSRLKDLIEKLKVIPANEQPEVLKKAIAAGGHTFESLTIREKASIGNRYWDWEKEYLNV